MKFLKSFNESYSEIYDEVFDRIKDCFRDFEDEGWYWIEMSSGYVTNDPYMFTHLPMPYFKYIMRKDDEITQYDPYDRKKFNFTGTIDTNGEITWESRVTTWAKNYSSDDFKDFIIAVKRLQDQIDISFKFSYNNIHGIPGTERIVIEGKI